MSLASVQMFMQKLNHLINCKNIPSINNWAIKRKRHQFQLLYEELSSMIQTLYINQHQDVEKVVDLKRRFTDAAEEAQYLVDLFLSGVHIWNNGDARILFKSVVVMFVSCFHIRKYEHFTTSLNLDDVRRSFKLVKVELKSMNIMGSSRILDGTLNQSVDVAAPAPARVSYTRISRGSKKLLNEIVVGFDGDAERIRDKLVEDRKKVDVVSIVGMGGIGKTTLATKVYNDGYVKHHFYIRVWITVSQTYNKRDVLIQILKSIRGQLQLEKDDSDSQLREMVHKHLIGKRYLIVVDDIWDIETWDDLKVFFPHDNNGSRILLTSRLIEVAKHANSHGLIHHIGYLNKERSWELLCQKVFHGNECPEWSIKPGMEIVKSCKGLPLAVAVIAGVLAKEAWSERIWMEIAYRTSSFIVGDENGCMETLSLSYNHLPLHLRECFLYLGGFPEDNAYSVRMLKRLWVAEGFIEQDGIRSLEDIAEGYLMDLIDRNLVIGTHKEYNGVVTYCKVHDLVRELCLKKAKEEGFFNHSLDDITTPPCKPARMFINKDISTQIFRYPSVKNLRSILSSGELRYFSDDISRCFRSFVLLRVLILERELDDFPEGMELLVHLRYLSIYISSTIFPSSICKLWNLQTLRYCTSYGILPINISDLVNLRHLEITGQLTGEFFLLHSIEKPMKLQTLWGVMLSPGVHNLQKCFPCIKELKCNTYSNEYYDFKSLTYLEKLKITGFVTNHPTFPGTLKTLTLRKCCLAWSAMSIIQRIPNLQVLKLKLHAFKGSCWNTNGQQFPQLKFLKLWRLDIQRWEAYSTTFPCLRQLEIVWCKDLEEIPLEIGEIPTLELIKIKKCRLSVSESVRRIQEEQQDSGNYDLDIDISEELPF